MIPLISPYSVSRWHTNPAGWSAKRATFLAANSPPTLPASLADSVEVGLSGERRAELLEHSDLPSGCASMDMHTMENPAGRVGSHLVTFVLHPSATWSGVCVVWVAGHTAHVDDWTTYAQNPEPENLHSLITPSLAGGHMVIAADMPVNGSQVGGRVVDPVAWTTIDGEVTSYEGNELLADADGGAPSTRFFTDYLVRSMNQVEHDFAPTKWAMAGHSGGGNYTAILSALESRFSWIGSLHGGCPMVCWADWASTGRVQPGDPEQYYAGNTPIYCGAGEAIDFGGLVMLAASWPGRKTFVSHGVSDTTWTLTSVADLRAYYEAANAHLLSTGNQIELYEGTDHGVYADEAETAFASMQAALT